MGTKVERNRMNVAVADVRKCTRILVEREWINTRSRMVAYDRVGSQVGASGAWIRRFVNGYEGAGLSWIVGQNIIALYEKYQGLCDRVEANTASMESENAAAQSHSEEFSSESSALLPPVDY